MTEIKINFVTTAAGNPLFFNQLCEDGYGEFEEESWSNLEDFSDSPLTASDYQVNNGCWRPISRVRDRNDNIIDRSTLRIRRATLTIED